MYKFFGLIIFIIASLSCSDVSKEKIPLVSEVAEKVRQIDSNHRVHIVEDDFHQGDSIYKIRGYFMKDQLVKLVGVLYTRHIERDDYFYFEEGQTIFSGHVVVSRDDQIASEYKYYYGSSGIVEEALQWKDRYEPGKQFPHERFKEFSPDADSLRQSEELRLSFFKKKIDLEGMKIHEVNENQDAN